MTRSDPPRDATLRTWRARRAAARPRSVAVTEACSGCGACLLTGPAHAIRPVAGSGSRAGQPSYAALTVLADRCTGCLECVEICPADAVTVLTPVVAPAELNPGFPAGRPGTGPDRRRRG